MGFRSLQRNRKIHADRALESVETPHDRHFFHLLHEEFDVSTVVAPAIASTLLREAFDGCTDELHADAQRACAPPVAAPMQSRRAPSMIFRLYRREVRVPTACRVCRTKRASQEPRPHASIVCFEMQKNSHPCKTHFSQTYRFYAVPKPHVTCMSTLFMFVFWRCSISLRYVFLAVFHFVVRIPRY